MRILKLKLEDRFYRPIYNMCLSLFDVKDQIKECKEGYYLEKSRSFLNIAGHSEDQEHLLIHLFGKQYVMLEYWYDESYSGGW